MHFAVLAFIKTHGKGIEIYLSTFGDFELGISRALHANFTGISFKFGLDESIDTESLLMIHKKGLKIHLWTLNDSNQIKEAVLLQPDYIQTDNIEFAKTFQVYSKIEQLSNTIKFLYRE